MTIYKTYGLFISHAWSYNEDYYSLIERLESCPNFYFRNYSVPIHDPLIDPGSYIGQRQLNDLLDSQIRPASVVIFIGRMYFYHRQWILRELDIAKSYGKPCLLVRPLNQQQVPAELRAHCAKEVGWYIDDIVRAIQDIGA